MDNELHAIEAMERFINVVCLALPTGETLWWEARRKDGKPLYDYGRSVFEKWWSEHPEFNGTPCNMGMVVITMPREKFLAIGAQCGPGCFEFPEENHA